MDAASGFAMAAVGRILLLLLFFLHRARADAHSRSINGGRTEACRTILIHDLRRDQRIEIRCYGGGNSGITADLGTQEPTGRRPAIGNIQRFNTGLSVAEGNGRVRGTWDKSVLLCA